MGFFSSLFKKKKTPAYAPAWAKYGSSSTQTYLGDSFSQAKEERSRQMGLLNEAYGHREKTMKSGFKGELKNLRRDISRSAASRGLGKSTVALGVGASGDLLFKQQQALGNLKSEKAAAKAGIKPVNKAHYNYLLAKNRYGALEPYWMSGYQQKGKRPIGTILGGAIGGYFGGPAGAAAGAQIGGSI